MRLVSAALFSLIFVFPADSGSGQLTFYFPDIHSTRDFSRFAQRLTKSMRLNLNLNSSNLATVSDG